MNQEYHRPFYGISRQKSHNDQEQVFFDSTLFKDVQLSGLFDDSKTFADAIPKRDLQAIVEQYNAERQRVEFNLALFVEQNFTLPEHTDLTATEKASSSIEHIESLWSLLEQSSNQSDLGSLLPLDSPYIIPGGRFREIYYWDSYFTALGLVGSGRVALAQSMLNNFIDLQATYGCIPNGNRRYYLSRSQPPILALLAELLLPFQQNREHFLRKTLPAIETEYSFWMQGSDILSPQIQQHRRVVQMPDGNVLNRYWDDQASPRPESYREDIELAESLSTSEKIEFYRNIRAACESGWDFSSRWLSGAGELQNIRTTQIVPVDLNCLLYKQEQLMAEYYQVLGDNVNSDNYLAKAEQRKVAISRYLWSEQSGFYYDYDLENNCISTIKSVAASTPLFVGIASQHQADLVAHCLQNEFLQAGGLVTTTEYTAEQWDAPNGWAPLQWFASQGLLRYQHDGLAREIMSRWLATVESYFQASGKIMEKYDVCQQAKTAQGGEYDVQEGFGWTNGVCHAFAQLVAQES